MATRKPPPPDAGADTFAAAAGTPPAPNPFAAAATQAGSAPVRQRSRFWRWSAGLFSALCALVLVLGATAWVWLDHSTSLATALAQAARWLPAGQSLESRDVSGSLRGGGHIGWLRWSSPTLAVEVTEARLGWSLAPLLQRSVHLSQVQAVSVRIIATPDPDAPRPTPPEQLVLPVRVYLPFQIDRLEWVGPPSVQAHALAGTYRYDGVQHQLEIEGVDWAQGHYSGQASVQALAPMALKATLAGQVRTTTPGSEQPLHLSAHATLQGTLATAAAQLQVQAQLRPTPVPAPTPSLSPSPLSAPTPAPARAPIPAPAPNNTLQADVSADVMPWAPQPLRQASAQLRAINLAALWPQAPVTDLHGSVQAGPQADGWHIAAQLRNDLAGPWDLQRLPANALDASADYDGAQWRVPQARVQVGAGHVALQGAYTPADGTLEGQAQVQALNPAALHRRLDAAPLSGTLQAHKQGAAVQWRAHLQAARTAVRPARSAPAKAAPLRIQNVRANGTWQAPLLALHSVDIDALQAQLRGQKIDITLGDSPGARGTLALTVPGATVRANGHLSARSGAGELQANVAAAERVQSWLQTLPGLASALKGTTVQGQTRLAARWEGGWHSLQQQWQTASGTTASATATSAAPPPRTPFTPFTVQATLDAAALTVALPPPDSSAIATRIQINRLHAVLAGSLAQATLSLDGQADIDKHRATLQTQLSAGLGSASPAATQWRAQVTTLQLQLQEMQRPGTWALQLAQPLALTLRQMRGANARSTLEAAAGQARLTGPVPGTTQLRWQPLRLEQSAQGAVQLQTRGELSGLPLAWLEALAPAGQGPLAELGLGGNLVLDGQWDIDAADTLRASASLQRASGDIRVLTGAPPTTTTVRSTGTDPKATASTTRQAPGTPAGVRQALLQLTAQGDQVRARLLWDSERAGHIEADASTRLTRQGNGWTWTPDTPLAARVRARLPDVGVWSALAPPGWRVRGTLDADATLSGSLQAPQWQGRLDADHLAVQSLLDGVDLQDGRLRSSLRGQRLDITELSLRGGPGSSARIAGYSGNLTPAPRDGGSLQGSGSITWGGAAGQANAAAGSGIAFDFSAQAQALQVLVRADRQASVSGTLRAGLQQGQLTLRGQLTVNRATIILPEASAPRLGSDVVVRSVAIDQANAAKAALAGQAAARAQTARPPDIAVTLDLGQDFALQGHGITTRLRGTLDIRSNAATGSVPRVTGEVHTVQGRYRAWGQVLDVETGLARFNGPYDNPALDILALRPNISVRAGVQVTGTAKAPRVVLYSDPELPDAEKLSWVVVGRSTAAGGAEAALLQQAALTLLGSRGSNTDGVARRLGLDEIGFKGPQSGNDASAAAITLGKRLSSKLYVTYEQSLSGVLGSIYIFYDLSRRLTLRGQTGTQSAVDIIYTVEHD